MQNYFRLFIVAICFHALPAASQCDPEPNKLGVYFDAEASSSMLTVLHGSSFKAYVVVTNFTSPQIQAIEFSYEIVAQEGALQFLARTGAVLPQGGTNFGDSSDPFLGEYIVGLEAPIPTTSTIPFVEWEFTLLSLDVVVGFRIGPVDPPSLSDGFPAAEDGGNLVSLGVNEYHFIDHHLYDYGYYNAVFAPRTVATITNSFGGVKVLYR